MKKWGLKFLYVFLVSLLVLSCEEKTDLTNQKKDEGKKVDEIPSLETGKNDTTNKDTVENNTSRNEEEITENDNAEENEEEWLEPEEIHHVILTSKGFALLSNEGVVSYEGYDPEDNLDWVRFATIKETLNSTKIKNIYFNNNEEYPAFVALSEEGNVFTWGDRAHGGDPTYESNEYPEVSKVNGVLSNVIRIIATKQTYGDAGAFVALKSDKTAVTWGQSMMGGDSSSVSLVNIKKIVSADMCFAALKFDGTIEIWGIIFGEDDIYDMEGTFEHIENIFSNSGAFAMIKEDKTVVTRGDNDLGGYSFGTGVSEYLVNIDKIFVSDGGFIAVKQDNTAIYWDSSSYSIGVYSAPENTNGISKFLFDDRLCFLKAHETRLSCLYENYSHIENVFFDRGYGFALNDEGSTSMVYEPDDGMMVQGSLKSGINTTLASINNVRSIVSSVSGGYYGVAWAVLTENNDVFTLGDDWAGGNPNSDNENVIKAVGSLTNVKDVVASVNDTDGAFAALRYDGTATSWGHKDCGADTTSIIASSGDDGTSLVHIENIYSYSSWDGNYFVGVREDGSYVAWGNFVE